MKKVAFVFVITVALLALPSGCEEQPPELVDRESKIPADQEKIPPETDLLPPILHSDEYEQPVPMPYPINTAGAEDSGFIMPDGWEHVLCMVYSRPRCVTARTAC
jgi:hypothetical protein